MKIQSIILFTSVAAGNVQAGPPDTDGHGKSLKGPKYAEYDSDKPSYDQDDQSKHARPLFGYGDDRHEDCASYNNHHRFADNGDGSKVSPHCQDGERTGWIAVKRQGGGPDGNANGNANGNDRPEEGTGGVDNDGNGRIDDNDDNGNDRVDDNGNGRNDDGSDRSSDGTGVNNDANDRDGNNNDNGNDRDGDGNGRYDNGDGPDGDGNDGPRGAAVGMTVPLLGVVSIFAASFMLLM